MIDRSQVDPPEYWEDDKNECTITNCSGNCANCEMEEADYHHQMEKDEGDNMRADQKYIDDLAADDYERGRDERNEQ